MICSHLSVKHVARCLPTRSPSPCTWMHTWVRTSCISVTSVARPWRATHHCRYTGARIQVKNHLYVTCVVRHLTNVAICEFTSGHIRVRSRTVVNIVARHSHSAPLWLYISDITQGSALISVTYAAKTLFQRHYSKHIKRVMECRNRDFVGMWIHKVRPFAAVHVQMFICGFYLHSEL